jgi:hypothetical protein
MLRFFSNLILLYPKMGALVAQECGLPGAQTAQALFGMPEPRPTAVIKTFKVPEVTRRQAPRKRKIASIKKKPRRKAA